MGNDGLNSLYPWQAGAARRDGDLAAQLAASTQAKASDSAAVKQAFFDRHSERVVAAARAIAGRFANGGQLLCMGNGGSACDAAHIAVEFSHPVTAGRRALPSINLGADPAMLTAVGNDVGFDHVFVRQLIAHGHPEDALIGVSTSGNSPNLLRAFEKASELGMATVALSGAGGGALASSTAVQHCLVVDSDSVHRIQETHLAIYHILWDLVHAWLAEPAQ